MSRASMATLSVGESMVSVQREGASVTSVARILGKFERDGSLFVVLDRLIHEAYESTLGDWTATGAITTVLSRRLMQN